LSNFILHFFHFIADYFVYFNDQSVSIVHFVIFYSLKKLLNRAELTIDEIQ